ncbi:TIGR00282 family metallophosphoesterase [Candidatus Mycoplasma pogonae]
MNKKLRILFIGDVFGESGIAAVEKYLPIIKAKADFDFVICQAENVSGRKGMNRKDYQTLKAAGINAFTFGNHVWSKKEIQTFINNNDIIRPANIDASYQGEGTRVFNINGISLRVTSLMGIIFNKLLPPWGEEYANSFFDAIDAIIANDEADYHLVDFHAETTSEKNVLSLYLDGKVTAVLGTHTHVQTNDARILANGTAFITDVGMTGPCDSAIGANYDEVYRKMRYNSMVAFLPSNNPAQFNAVHLTLAPRGNKIKTINIYRDKISIK